MSSLFNFFTYPLELPPFGNNLSYISDNTNEITQISSVMACLNNENIFTGNIVDSIKLGSIAASAAQFNLGAFGVDFNGLTQAIEEANLIKEPLGNILSYSSDSANEISQITSAMACLNTENIFTDNIVDSINMGLIAASSAQYQLDAFEVGFNGLTQAIEEANRLKEALDNNLLSSIYNNVGTNLPNFYNWNILGATITEAIGMQETLVSDFPAVSPLAVYKDYKRILYELKWFPRAILTVGIRSFYKLINVLSNIDEEYNHLEEHIDNEIEAFFTENDIKRINKSWANSELEEFIVRILGESLNAYLRGEYVLTISTLATMWECLILKKLHITNRQKPKLTNKQFKELVSENDYEVVFSNYYFDFIVSQCEGVDNLVDGVPNRHSIAHGWYRNYPTKKAALNAILLTDFIINLEPKVIKKFINYEYQCVF